MWRMAILLWIVLVAVNSVDGLSLLTGRFSFLHSAGNINNIKISPTAESMAISKTVEVHTAIRNIENSGEKVFAMHIGEPDYQPPQEVVDATVFAVQSGLTKYTAVVGDAMLRKVIAQDFTCRKGIECTENEILVSNCAKQAVLQALLSVVKQGDVVLIPAPYWPSYPDMVKMCGGTPVIISTSASDGYALRPDDLRKILTVHGKKAACLIMCNPNNPSGWVGSEREMRQISEVLVDFPWVTVISDEIYERLCYDGAMHTSIASLPGMAQRTVTVNGPSKAYAMTGFRIGYSVAPAFLSHAMGKLQTQITSCASSISQSATLASLARVSETNPSWLGDRLEELNSKRNLALSLLRDIPGVTCHKPQGAFYLFPDVSQYYGRRVPGSGVVISDSNALCAELLRASHVALMPGEAFGMDNNVRICFAVAEGVIRGGLVRLKQFLESLEGDATKT